MSLNNKQMLIYTFNINKGQQTDRVKQLHFAITNILLSLTIGPPGFPWSTFSHGGTQHTHGLLIRYTYDGLKADSYCNLTIISPGYSNLYFTTKAAVTCIDLIWCPFLTRWTEIDHLWSSDSGCAWWFHGGQGGRCCLDTRFLTEISNVINL